MIRPYEEKDLQSCAAVFCNAFSAPPWNEQWTAELAQTRVRELMCTPVSYGCVCEENGRILGFLAGRLMTYLYGREYVIDEFCVSPDLQRSGIGTALLQHVRNELTAEGFVGMFLNTRRGYPSEAFYLKNGFVHADDMIALYLHLK